jgi:hypothetical protein
MGGAKARSRKNPVINPPKNPPAIAPPLWCQAKAELGIRRMVARITYLRFFIA